MADQPGKGDSSPRVRGAGLMQPESSRCPGTHALWRFAQERVLGETGVGMAETLERRRPPPSPALGAHAHAGGGLPAGRARGLQRAGAAPVTRGCASPALPVPMLVSKHRATGRSSATVVLAKLLDLD